MSSLVVAPATAERVPAECRRSWNRKPTEVRPPHRPTPNRRKTRLSGPGAPQCPKLAGELVDQEGRQDHSP